MYHLTIFLPNGKIRYDSVSSAQDTPARRTYAISYIASCYGVFSRDVVITGYSDK